MWSTTLLVFWFAAIVCVCLCAPQDTIVFPTDGDTNIRVKPEVPSVSKSAEMCKKYSSSVYYVSEGLTGEKTTVDTCVRVEPLITNGTPAQAREFPHMALIGYPANYPSKNSKKWSCGGSLISERFVLSAAHCNSLNKVKPKYVRLGDYNYLDTKDDEENNARTVEFDIIEIITHPQYDSNTNFNDITLYKLDRDVKFNEYVRPICLHTHHQLFRSFFIISGWGHVDYGEPGDGILMKGNVTYVPGNECGEELQKITKKNIEQVRDRTQICAADFVKGTDTCQGDSGGPLQYPLREPYCMYSQVGITSFGFKCGEKVPAVYTRVSFYVPWIESIVWP